MIVIYRWIPQENIIIDHITSLAVPGLDGLASPFGTVAVAGRLEYPGNEILFD